MSTKNRKYWEEREAKQRLLDIKNEDLISRRINKIYAELIEEMNRELNGFYIRYALKNGLTMAEVKKRADSLDIKEYARLAKRMVAERDFSNEANDAMAIYNLAMKKNRIDLLMDQIGLKLVDKTARIEEILREEITGRAIEEIERQAGILGDSVLENAEAVPVLVDSSFHSAKWSERLWKNQDSLRRQLNKTLTNYLVRGIDTNELLRKLTDELSGRVKNASYAAKRLVVTERQRVASAMQMKCYESAGVTYYRFITEPNCCPECSKLNGKVFKVEDGKPGVNMRPIHPMCRCSTAMDVGGDDYDEWLNTYQEHELTYDEWKAYKPEAVEMLDDAKSRGVNLELWKGIRIIKVKTERGNKGTIRLLVDAPKEIHNYPIQFEHILEENGRKIDRNEVLNFIYDNLYVLTTWKGMYENYFSSDGAAYVNVESKFIRTAFTSKDYKGRTKPLIDEVKKYVHR